MSEQSYDHRLSEYAVDLAVIGGGVGGVAAALAALDRGMKVLLTEETPVLGGQFTAQAVPPDEHPWIESSLTPPSYQDLRSRIRDYYRRNYPLTPAALADQQLSPGLGLVSALCSEPRVVASVIEELLAPHIASGRLTVLRESVPIHARVDGDSISAVELRSVRTSLETAVTARYFIDATELGDLLPLAGIESVIGAESATETGELHAPAVADPLDQQAISWSFAMDYFPDENHTIARPDSYTHWRDHVDPFWPGPQLAWRDVEPISLTTRTRPLFTGDTDAVKVDDLWHYRRILARKQFAPEFMNSDITLVNWPQIDYWSRPLLGVSEEEKSLALREARALSESFLYWMQTEAPRHDGGTGYPGLRPRGDVLGSNDHLAIAPYIRESRRIRAVRTVTEGDIGREMRGQNAGSTLFNDSVGIGYYRIDLHPSTSGRTYVDIDCFPFQIPLGALIPQRVTNVLAGGKNIGTTHITNGAYRLHPVEWSIGEAAGALAAYSIDSGSEPHAVAAGGQVLADFQRELSTQRGIVLAWPESIRTEGPAVFHVDLPERALAVELTDRSALI